MSSIEIYLQDHFLILKKERARKSNQDYLQIDLQEFTDENPTMITSMTVNSEKMMHCVLFEKPVEDKVVMAYCGEKFIHVAYGYKKEILFKIIKAYAFSPRQKLKRSGLTISYKGYLYNPFGLPIKTTELFIDENNKAPIQLPQSYAKIKRFRLLKGVSKKVFFPMDSLLYVNASINCNIFIKVVVDEEEIFYPVSAGYIKKGNSRMNYIPYQSRYLKEWALHLRKTRAGNLAFVRRLREEKENTFDFMLKENKCISFFMYYFGKWKRKRTKKPVNLFYEKFASKAEEGAYDLFLKARSLRTSENYFVIAPDSADYQKIKNEKNVVAKWSWKYYWLLYTSDNFIATEAPIHINIVRSNNKYFRRSTFEKKFIFLQHGVTYLKRHGVNSPFVKGKEATPDYIVVGSEKEQDIISDMLGLKEEQIIVAGLPVFANINWESIKQSSPDKVMVMLTWKPYEEFITDFEQTSYYQYTKEIYEILKKYIPEKNIMIIPHPKIAELMENTDFSKTIWRGEISKALSQAKLLITDYSSVCYNSFYQGGGVVFYQPDLERYEQENGDLIPENDEYIGYRVYTKDNFEQIIRQGIHSGSIDLGYFRTPEFIQRYLEINSFIDGKNIERIFEQLKRLEIL